MTPTPGRRAGPPPPPFLSMYTSPDETPLETLLKQLTEPLLPGFPYPDAEALVPRGLPPWVDVSAASEETVAALQAWLPGRPVGVLAFDPEDGGFYGVRLATRELVYLVPDIPASVQVLRFDPVTADAAVVASIVSALEAALAARQRAERSWRATQPAPMAPNPVVEQARAAGASPAAVPERLRRMLANVDAILGDRADAVLPDGPDALRRAAERQANGRQP